MPQFTKEQIEAMPIGEQMFYDRVGWETNADDISMSFRYDTFYNNKTGEIIDNICQCEPGTCEFTDNWIADGRPTHIDLNNLDAHSFEGEVIEFN